jgi:DNA-binding transcriptional ArsR family regulator
MNATISKNARASEQCVVCVGYLTEAVGLSQPTVSHHLRFLVGVEILNRDRAATGLGAR